MSVEISTAFVEQFKDTVTLLAQQRGSKLRGSLMEETLTGKRVAFEQVAPTRAQRTTTRHADSPLISTPHRRRWASAIDVEWGDLIDDFDRLNMLIDPESAYTQNAGFAVGREWDDIIFEKFFADAVTGENGDQIVSFPASNEIALDFDGDGTDEGLTVPKLRQARQQLLENEVDLEVETPHIAIPAKAQDDLLNFTEVTSADFNTVRALVNGELDTYLGFRFIRTERVPKDSNGNFLCPVWVPTGMGVAVRQNPTARLTERSDKRFSTYVYYSTSVGASRLEESKVHQIKVVA